VQEVNATIELTAADPATFDRPLLSNPDMTAGAAWAEVDPDLGCERCTEQPAARLQNRWYIDQ